MKQDKRELELQVKEEALQHMLTSHLQLLCSLDMISEVGDNTIFPNKPLKNYKTVPAYFCRDCIFNEIVNAFQDIIYR